MAKKNNESRCVLTLPLLTLPYQEHILEKRFAIMTKIRDALVHKELKKLNNLERRKDYKELVAKINSTPKEKRKPLYKQKDEMIIHHLAPTGTSGKKSSIKSEFEKDVKPFREHYLEHVYSDIAIRIADDLWTAFDKYLWGNGEKIHFRKLDSVACKKINNGMKYENGIFTWKGGQLPKDTLKEIADRFSLSIRVAAPKNAYEQEMLKKEIKYLRVVRKWVKNRYKYYLQFTLVGEPVSKGRVIGQGRVGIDIGTQSIALVSKTHAQLLTLTDQVQENHEKALRLQRKMDRSRRAMNPENFQSDGTIKRGVKLRWKDSKRYKKLAGELRHLQRKNADIRKYQHNCLANAILEMGNEIYVESMDYRALQRRAKKTTKNAKGRFNRKKRFGKSLANRAPAMLLTILQNKVNAIPGASLQKVDTWTFRASQYDHTDQTYHKKQLSDRVAKLSNGDVVQRDLYAAFLLMNAARPSLPTAQPDHTDQTLCEQTYPQFLLNHQNEIKRHHEADPMKQLSSFGISSLCES